MKARHALWVAALGMLVAAVTVLLGTPREPTPEGGGAVVPESADAAHGPPTLSARTRSPAAEPSGATISLVGRVLDDRRSPVARATVEALDGGEPLGKTTTGADGRFRVEGLPRPSEGWRSVAIRALGPDRRIGVGSTAFLRPESPDVVDAGDVVLGRGLGLAVRVVEAGTPIRDAHVALRGDRVWLLQATTGADGVARFDPVPAGPTAVLAWTSTPPRAGRGTAVPGGPNGDSVTIALAPARTVEVVVVDAPSGRPIEGARFDVAPVASHVPPGGAYGLGAPLVDPTGPDGRTRIHATVAADELSLSRPRAPDFDGEGWGARVGAGEREARLEMRARRTLRFDVEKGDAPIPADGTPIRLEPADEGAPTPVGRAQMEGRTLVVEGASPLWFSAIAITPDDSYARLVADPEDLPPWERDRNSASGGQGGHPGPSGAPPAISFLRPRRVSVLALRPDHAPAEGVWFAIGDPPSAPVGAARATDAQGRAEFSHLRVQQSVKVLLLENASHPWSGQPVGSADLTKGDAEVTVIVPDRRRFRVRTTIDGAPGLPPRYALFVNGVMVEDVREDPVASTIEFAIGLDLDARGVVASIAAYPLASTPIRVAPVPDRDPIEMVIAMRRSGSLTCRVLEPADRAYELRVERWSAEEAAWTPVHSMAWSGLRSRPDGLLRLSPLDPGTYRIRDVGSGAVARPVEVRGGEETSFPPMDLSAAAWVSGRVMGPDGEGVAIPRVTVEGADLVPDVGWSGRDNRSFGQSPPPPRGSFRVRVPGDRPVTLHPQDSLRVPAAVGGTCTVTGARDDVVLRLADGRDATVRLVCDGGVPGWLPRSARVRLFRGFPSGPSGAPHSEHEGVVEGDRLRFGGFQPGVWTVWIDLPIEGSNAVAPAVLRDAVLGEAHTDLGSLRFERGSRVLLRVRVNEGRAAVPVRATATRLDAPGYDRSNQGSPDAIGGLGPGRFQIRVRAEGQPDAGLLEEVREVDGEHDIEAWLDLREPRPTQSHDAGR